MPSEFPIVVKREGEWFIASCPAIPDAKGKGRTRNEALASFAMAITTEGSDPSIDEVRAVRHQISAEHGHDPERLCAHLMELQKRHADRLLYSPPQKRDQ